MHLGIWQCLCFLFFVTCTIASVQDDAEIHSIKWPYSISWTYLWFFTGLNLQRFMFTCVSTTVVFHMWGIFKSSLSCDWYSEVIVDLSWNQVLPLPILDWKSWTVEPTLVTFFLSGLMLHSQHEGIIETAVIKVRNSGFVGFPIEFVPVCCRNKHENNILHLNILQKMNCITYSMMH